MKWYLKEVSYWNNSVKNIDNTADFRVDDDCAPLPGVNSSENTLREVGLK